MPRVAIVEYLMSPGGLERVLRGLARAFQSLPEAEDWDITFLLSRYDSAHREASWPSDLVGPRIHVEWLSQGAPATRALVRAAHFQGTWGTRALRIATGIAVRGLRAVGPAGYRRWAGDPRAAIEDASRRFDLMCFAYPMMLRPPRLHCPVVTTPQDFNFRHFVREGSFARRRHERITRAWLAASNRILFTSEAVFAEMERAYPEAAPRAHVVHLGIETDSPPPSPAELDRVRRARGLPERFVLVGGWVAPHKNQIAVVEAIAALRARSLGVPIVFVGPNASHLTDAPVTVRRTPYAQRVKALLASRGFVHGRDFFAPGYVSDEEIRCLHRLASVYVLPSFYEGFGLPSLEALRAGCPTIVSAIPPLAEQNRLLGGIVPTFDPSDASALADRIQHALERPEEARAAARLAAERIPTAYDWRRTARAYLQHFRAVLRTGADTGEGRQGAAS